MTEPSNRPVRDMTVGEIETEIARLTEGLAIEKNADPIRKRIRLLRNTLNLRRRA